MFKALYNANCDINKRIDSLNSQYLDLLRNSHQSQLVAEFNIVDGKQIEAKQNLKNKIKKLTNISQEYRDFIETNQQLKANIAESKEIADSVEKLLDEVIGSLEVSEEQRQQFDLDLSTLKLKDQAVNQLEEDSDPDEDKENSIVHQQSLVGSEPNESSDKENSILDFGQREAAEEEESNSSSDNNTYFSPTISCSKITAFGPAFTPASKSTHKDRSRLPQPRHH